MTRQAEFLYKLSELLKEYDVALDTLNGNGNEVIGICSFNSRLIKDDPNKIIDVKLPRHCGVMEVVAEYYRNK